MFRLYPSHSLIPSALKSPCQRNINSALHSHHYCYNHYCYFALSPLVEKYSTLPSSRQRQQPLSSSSSSSSDSANRRDGHNRMARQNLLASSSLRSSGASSRGSEHAFGKANKYTVARQNVSNKSKMRGQARDDDDDRLPDNYKGPDFAFSPKRAKSSNDAASRRRNKRGIYSDRFSESFRSQEHTSNPLNVGPIPATSKTKKGHAYVNTLEQKRERISGKKQRVHATEDPEILRLVQKGRIQKLRDVLPKYLDLDHKRLLLQCAINGRLNHVAKRMFEQWPSLLENVEAVVQMAIGVWGKEGDENSISSRISFVDANAINYSQKILIRNAYINALVRNDKVNEAWEKFHELFTLDKHPERNPKESNKMEPTIVSFSTLMSGYAKKGDTEKLESLYKVMVDLDILYLHTDTYIHNLFLQAAVVRNDEDLLWKFFSQFFNSNVAPGTENNIIAPNIITVNHILKFYAQRGDTQKMESYLRRFEQEDPKRRLNSRSALILLQGYFNANQLGKAEEIFRLYYNYGIRKHSGLFEAPLEVCHMMLEVFDRTNQLDAMQELFDRMYLGRTMAIPEKSTFEICIQAYKKRSSYNAGSAANLKKLERLLEQFEKNQEKANKEAVHVDSQKTAAVMEADFGETEHFEDNSLAFEETEGGDEPDEEAQYRENDLDKDIEEELKEEFEFNRDDDNKERYLW